MHPCNCVDCVSACLNDPGRLVPADLQRFADNFQLSLSDLISRFLVIIPAFECDESVLQLAPAKLRNGRFVVNPGRIAFKGYSKVAGRCIFLSDDLLCQVHPFKPQECRSYMGCRNTFNGRFYNRKQVEEYFFKKWKNFFWADLSDQLQR